MAELERISAQAATPLVLDYSGDSFQSLGAAGYDLFGFVCTRLPFAEAREILMPEGCSYLIERELFEKLGGFDPVFFMYADGSICPGESGSRATKRSPFQIGAFASPGRRPCQSRRRQPGGGIPHKRDTKRFYANRNSLLVLLKNCQHVLLLWCHSRLVFCSSKRSLPLLLVGRWSFVRRAYWDVPWLIAGDYAAMFWRAEADSAVSPAQRLVDVAVSEGGGLIVGMNCAA